METLQNTKSGDKKFCFSRPEAEKIAMCFKENEVLKEKKVPVINSEPSMSSWTDPWYVKVALGLVVAYGAFEVGRASK